MGLVEGRHPRDSSTRGVASVLVAPSALQGENVQLTSCGGPYAYVHDSMCRRVLPVR